MASISNMEEAANLASEFVLSLDNLPHEVQFLLSEIRLKDVRSQEIQQDINKDTAKYLKQGLRGQGSQKTADVQAKATADFASAQALADEKIALAERLVVLLTRTRARLDHDLGRMLVLQGELASSQLATYSSITASTASAAPVAAAVESMRLSLAPEPVFSQSISTSTSTSAATSNKRRKLTGTSAVKMPSPAPSAISVQRSRASRMSPVASRGRRAAAAQPDDDAEGEVDAEDADEANAEDDNGIYCFCQRTSFGEMVACDNEDCRLQWFHLECVGLADAPEGKWYCRDCAPKFTAPPRKRNRK